MAALVLGLLMTAMAQEGWIARYGSESSAANQSCNAKDYRACREHVAALVELLDGRGDVVYRLARIDAALGNTPAAIAWLERFSRMGLTFADLESDASLASLKSTPGFAESVARIRAAREPVTHSRPFLTLPEKDLVAEDLAYDPATRRFLVSSVRHGKILAVSRDGKTAEFLLPGQSGIWGVLALRADPKRRYLWATTAAMPEALGYQAADKGRSALLRFSLDSGALLKRYDLPRDGDHALGDMTLGTNGDVFVSDGFGAVYRVDHARDALETLIPPGTFRSPQTPALTPDQRRLLVADYSRGIGIVDLATRESRLLAHPPDLSVGGIDGLYLAGRSLIAVQNGTAPPRLIRMDLNRDLTRVESWETVEANWAGLGAPTHGVLVGDRFYFIANSGWDRLADDGSLKPGAVFEAPTIRELPLKAATSRPWRGPRNPAFFGHR